MTDLSAIDAANTAALQAVHLTLDCLITPEQTYTYIDLPFNVPAHTARIDIAYTYDGAISSDPTMTGGNTIDIGVCDPRGSAFMTPGFRGWSGSARQQFHIALESATPGYLAGPIQPGIWTICLGAYKVVPGGCYCHVQIMLTPSDGTQPEPTFPNLLPVELTTDHTRHTDHWYKGDLHCHTVHSDGDSTVAEVIRIAQQVNFDFLAITDHNNRSQLAELAGLNDAPKDTGLILIPGYEVTTYHGHWNIWGLASWVDFRVTSPDLMQQAMHTAQQQGYLVSCNHPRPYGPPWEYTDVADYSCVEVWNGPWEYLNDMCVAFWEDQLKQGKHLVAVGGSDFHFSKEDHPAKLGTPTLYIHCAEEPSAANLLKNLRAGHAFISESPTGARVDLQIGNAMMGDTLLVQTGIRSESAACDLTVYGGAGTQAQLYNAHGLIAQFDVTDSTQRFTVNMDADLWLVESALYIRAQLVDRESGNVRAIGNPIYIENA